MTDKITEEQKQILRSALTEIKPVSAGIVMPAVTVEEAKSAWAAYQEMKTAVMTPDDIQLIQGKQFLKKSYWRKIATFFNLSVDVVSEHTETDETNGNATYHFVCKASAPNGRFAVGAGSCDLYDKAEWDQLKKVYVNRNGDPATPLSHHFARSTAETRAWNRAVSNLVGGGEVSAEEVVPARQNYSAPVVFNRPDKIEESACDVDHKTLVAMTVRKPGRNLGKQFKACQKCKYFEWL